MKQKFRVFFAPGRVNLIGEHTDYNGGHVFPCAITLGTYVAARKRKDRLITLYSVNRQSAGMTVASLDDLSPQTENGGDAWADYPKGVIHTFLQKQYPIDTGLDLIYYGNIPAGAGLSSSASIEVATGVMLRELFDLSVTNEEIAALCQQSENTYNGMRCGIMDQFASAMGKENHAIFLDTGDLSYEYVKLDMEGVKLVIANTNKPHKLTDSKYNDRRAECEAALFDLQRTMNIHALGELTAETFEANKTQIESPVNRKRAKHAVYENVRTIDAVLQLKQGNMKELGRLMREAHLSMRDDYEATGIELDTLAEEAWKAPGCIGSRMTGGGFGGCTVSLVEQESVEDFIDRVGAAYNEKIGYKADFYVMEIGGGPKELAFEELLLSQNPEIVQWAITTLVGYGLRTELLSEEDVIYAVNSVLMTLQLDTYDGSGQAVRQAAEAFDRILADDTQEEIGDLLAILLKILTDYACERGLTDGDSIVYRDLFDTRLMGLLTPRPSEVIRTFRSLYEADPQKATDWYYRFSKNTNYIRRDRIANDMKWQTMTDYGEMDITINLSKPEKDPKAIAAAGKMKPSGYPRCQLCRENEGYAGRINHPARQNHRIIPVTIQNAGWGFQYSPYVYYNEHCIVFHSQHVPMRIDHDTFCKLLDFVKQFPHYFVGSNADLPIVGGSILSHDHFQGGRYTFAMERAEVERTFVVNGFEDVDAGVVKWPMSVIRIASKDDARVIALADKILAAWRAYTDEDAFIYAETDGTPHNTITPIARMRDGKYELDLVLRNNITTQERPLGVFHPGEKLHHIKKENIGLIEVMGLAVLPARLKGEMSELKGILLDTIQKDQEAGERDKERTIEKITARLAGSETLNKHADWTAEFLASYDLCSLDETALDTILKKEISQVFVHVLEDAGVFKRDESGQAAFDRFIKSLQ